MSQKKNTVCFLNIKDIFPNITFLFPTKTTQFWFLCNIYSSKTVLK